MAIDLHVYANGSDPFIFSFGDVTLHVHSGAPPDASSTPTGPAAHGPVSVDQISATPRLIAYPTKTPVKAPIALTYVREVGEILPWLTAVESEPGHEGTRFRIDTISGSDRPEVHTLLEDLRGFGGQDVHVDIVGWNETGDA